MSVSMSLSVASSFSSSPPNWGLLRKPTEVNSPLSSLPIRRRFTVKACPFDSPDEPILREALKEPVAFMGGIFAGLLRLDLNEDPLKEWVTRTVESSGISAEEIDNGGANSEEEIPQPIEIE